MPVFTEAGEILDAIKVQEGIDADMRAQMQSDYDLIFLEDSGFTPKEIGRASCRERV